MSYHLTPVRMAIIIKNPQTISAGMGAENKEASYTTGENVKCWRSLYGEQDGGSSKETKTRTTTGPSNPTWAYTQKTIIPKRHMHPTGPCTATAARAWRLLHVRQQRDGQRCGARATERYSATPRTQSAPLAQLGTDVEAAIQ